jgi:glycosyltransferase involved in cell wall biosynthesis
VVLIEPISKSYELALPSKVFEYMMAGLPVLASQMLHVTELFASEEWITSVDVSDTDAIRNGIQQVLQLSQDESLRQRERTMALQDFHFERDATAILPLLERMLA